MQFLKIFAVTLLVGVAPSASAAPIHLVLGSQTDIMSFAVSIEYDAVGDSFTANGVAASWTNGGVTTGITDGVFDLSAEIDSGGNAIGGSLSITGYTATLLTGTLMAFGFDDTAFSEPDPFEFLFVTTGGTMGTMLGPYFGVILTSTTFLPVNPSGGDTVFEHDFSAPYAGIADAAITVPEPASAVLVGLGLAMLAIVRRTGRDTSRAQRPGLRWTAALQAALALASCALRPENVACREGNAPHKRKLNMYRSLKPLAAAALSLLMPLSLYADVIPLPPLVLPLIGFGPGPLSYDPTQSSRVLHIEAPAPVLITPAPALIDGGRMIADLKLDNGSCALQVGTFSTFSLHGTTTIGGTIYDGELLVGDVMEFGFEDTSPTVDKFELRVQLTGGSIMGLYPSNEIGVEVVSEDSDFAGICSVRFSGNAKGQLAGMPVEVCDLEVEKIGCVVPDPDLPGDACEGGVESISFTYTDDGCDDSNNDQDRKKSICVGDAPGDSVDIVATGKASKASKKHKASKKRKASKKQKARRKGKTPVFGTFHNVAIGESIQIDAAKAGLAKLGSELNLTVVDPVTAKVLQTIQMHTSCSQPLAPGDQFGSLNVESFSSAKGGSAGIDPVCVTEIPAPVEPCTEKGDKLFQIDLLYQGGDCTQTSHSQDPNKVDCDGDAGTSQPVRVKVFAGDEVYLDVGDVWIGDVVSALASRAGVDKMKAVSEFEILRGKDVLQSGFYHSSCSQPISVGDQFGALEVDGVGNLLGGTGEADVVYTISIGNPNADDLLVNVSDRMLGIHMTGISVPAGQEIEIEETTTITGPMTNTVTVTASDSLNGQFCALANASAEITQEEPPAAGAICTRSIQGTTLQYIGPSILGQVAVEFEAKEFEGDVVRYDLPGGLKYLDVLTLPSENDRTIDALEHGEEKLGSRTRIRIITNDGDSVVEETIHTSCSALYVRNQAAPLDGESGNKGEPSDNWFVWDFSQKP